MTRKKITTYVVTYSHEFHNECGTQRWRYQVMFDIEGRVNSETFKVAVEKATHRDIDGIIIDNIFKL